MTVIKVSLSEKRTMVLKTHSELVVFGFMIFIWYVLALFIAL